MKQYLKNELDKLERGIVATPTDEYLNDFTQANNGSNDFLLMQMAKNFGYKLALPVSYTHLTLPTILIV